jgi:hypothetical protein
VPKIIVSRLRPALCLAASLSTLLACSAQPPIVYGQQRYAALPPDTRVQVFMRESDIHQPFEVLGAVSAMDLGKYQMLGPQDSFPTLEEKARSIGGNGLIIDNYQPVKSGIFSTGYSVQARAIRLQGL